MKWLIGGLALALFACVGGDDTTDAATQGSLGGPCFSNNTCNTGLACVLVSGKGVCEQGDASVQDASGDTTVSDVASSDVGSDVTKDVSASDSGCSTTLTPAHACANPCSQSSLVCCEQTGQCVQTASSCSTGAAWACQSRGDCAGTQFCCAAGVTIIPNCPLSGQMTTSSQAVCQTACGSGTYAICLVDQDCPSTTPTCVGIQFGGVTVSLGICQ